MKKLFFILALLCAPSFATVSIHVNVKSVATTYPTSSITVRFGLQNCISGPPRIIATGIIAQTTYDFKPVAGTVTGTIYGNDEVDCGGNLASTYVVQYLVNGTNVVRSFTYKICAGAGTGCSSTSGSFDPSTASPVTANPAVYPPAGDSTYVRLDAGNSGAISSALALGLPHYTVAALPTGTTGKMVVVTDGNSSSDCTIGGGANNALCEYNGSAWVSLTGATFTGGIVPNATTFQSSVILPEQSKSFINAVTDCNVPTNGSDAYASLQACLIAHAGSDIRLPKTTAFSFLSSACDYNISQTLFPYGAGQTIEGWGAPNTGAGAVKICTSQVGVTAFWPNNQYAPNFTIKNLMIVGSEPFATQTLADFVLPFGWSYPSIAWTTGQTSSSNTLTTTAASELFLSQNAGQTVQVVAGGTSIGTDTCTTTANNASITCTGGALVHVGQSIYIPGAGSAGANFSAKILGYCASGCAGVTTGTYQLDMAVPTAVTSVTSTYAWDLYATISSVTDSHHAVLSVTAPSSLTGLTTYVGSRADGIRLNSGFAKVLDVSITNFGRDGIHLVSGGYVQDMPYIGVAGRASDLADDATIQPVYIGGNRGNGIYLAGGDGNNTRVWGGDFASNQLWGYQDNSFLGSFGYNPHTATNHNDCTTKPCGSIGGTPNFSTNTASIAAGSTALSKTGGTAFSAGMVGFDILVQGAGANGQALKAKIATFTDANDVVLDTPASVGVANTYIYYGTSNYAGYDIWKTAWAFSTGAITAGTKTLTLTAANELFVNQMCSQGTVNYAAPQIVVVGAGAGGANLNTLCTAFGNSQSITLKDNAGTTVTGATVYVEAWGGSYALPNNTGVSRVYGGYGESDQLLAPRIANVTSTFDGGLVADGTGLMPGFQTALATGFNVKKDAGNTFGIQCGSTTDQLCNIEWKGYSATVYWDLGKNSANDFKLYNGNETNLRLWFINAGANIYEVDKSLSGTAAAHRFYCGTGSAVAECFRLDNNGDAYFHTNSGVTTYGKLTGTFTGARVFTFPDTSATVAVVGTANSGNLLATGIIDGQVPITKVTAATFTFGVTYSTGYYLNQNATAATAITGTLGTATAGEQYCVTNSYNGTAADTGTITIQTSAAGQYLISGGTQSLSGGYIISGGAAGDSACVVGIDATHWQVYTSSGSWTLH